MLQGLTRFRLIVPLNKVNLDHLLFQHIVGRLLAFSNGQRRPF